MSTLSSKLVAVCLVTAISMVMYGCGGGGGGSSETVDPGPTQAQADAANKAATDAAAAATAAATAATAAVAKVTLADTTAAKAAATAATTAATAATAAAVAKAGDQGSVDAATAAAKAATDAAAAATAAVTAMNNEETKLVGMAADKVEAMRIAGIIGTSPKLADANAQDVGNQSIVTLPAPVSNDNFSLPEYATTSSNGTRTVLEFASSEMMPAAISEWNGGKHTHTSKNGETKHTVVMYDDKAADGDVAYSVFFTSANTQQDSSHRARTAVSGITTSGVLNINGGDISGNHGLFNGTTFPGPAEATTTHTGAQSIPGMFRGVSGLFKCESTCSSSKDKDGNLSGLSTGWTFVPKVIDGLDPTDDAAKIATALEDLMVPKVGQDEDYMIFGYWEQTIGEADTMLPFAEGKRDYGAVSDGGNSIVNGTATYSGAATGLYMKKSLTSDGQPTDPFSSGQFTADAMLTANFGGGEVAANHQFSITGTISNFMDGNSAISGAWTVSLDRKMIGDEPQRNIGDLAEDGHRNGTVAGTFDGVTSGGTLGTTPGNWSGAFYGVAGDDNTQPTSVGGIFDAHFSNGHVRGSFAANR